MPSFAFRFIRLFFLAAIMVGASSNARAQDYTNGLISHWTLDETSGTTAADSAGSNDGTMLGGLDAGINSSSGQIGEALNLDGASDYISTNPATGMGLVDEVTISAWIKPDNVTGDNKIFSNVPSGNADGFKLSLYSSRKIELQIGNGTGPILNRAVSGGTTLVNGQWYHVVGVYSNSGDYIRTYVNGVLDRELSTTEIMAASTTTNITIGAESYGSATNKFDGAVDDVRVYNRSLSAADISALFAYTGVDYTCANPNGLTSEINFNDDNRTLQYCNASSWVSIGKSAIPNTGLVGHWKLDETSGTTIADSAGSNTGTWTDGVNNDVVEETSTGQVGTAINFDGAGDYINAGSDTSLDDIFTGGGTLSAWIYPESYGSGTYARILSKGNSSAQDGWQLIYDGNQTEALSFHIPCNGSGFVFWKTNAGSIPLNTWSNIVLTFNRDNVSNTPSFYLNGTNIPSGVVVDAGSLASCATSFEGNDLGYDLLIGERMDLNRPFDGVIDDVRAYSRTLSATEIADMYNAQTANCSAPTSNLVGHWTLDETSGSTIADSSGNGNNGTWTDGINNDVTEETLAGQNGTALDFDGADNIITVPHAATLDISSGYTVSSWVYFDSTQTGGIFPAIISKNNSGGWGSGWVLGRSSAGGNISGGKVRLAVYHNRDINVPNAAYSNWIYPVDTWNYVTVSWDGNNVNYYLNGVLLETEIITTPPDTGSGDLNIGYGRANWYSAYHDGQIDDVRLYDRALSDTEIAALYGGTGGACSVSTCASPFAPKATLIFNTDYDVMQYCNGSNWIAMGPQGDGGAGCSNPSGLQAELIYNQDLNILQYCEGDEWIAMTPKLGTQLASGLIGHWTLDETSGNVIADSSGNGNDGTWVDSADNDVTGETTVGTVGTALTFDGTDDYIDISATAAGTGSYEDWTISTWYKSNTTTISDDQYITVFGDPIGGNNDVFLIAVGDDAGYEKAIRVFLNSNPSSGSNYYGTSDVNDMNWHHIVVTRNKAVGGDINIYVDGVLESNNEVADDIENYTFTIAGHSYIGDDPGATETVNGILDDVRLYNRTLSASEVTALYDIGTPPADIASGLAGHWTLDETSGGVIADSSGNGNNGTWIDGTNNDVTEETTTGTVNTTFTFDGTDDYIDVGAGINFTGEQSFTLNTWVYFDNDPLTRTSFFISKRNNYWLWWNGVGEFGLADNALIFGLRDGSFQDMVEAPWTPNANQWYLLTAIYDANADTASIYVDGALLLQETGQNYAMVGSAYGLELGQHYNDNRRIEGSLDDIRIYDRALSSAEVNALYNLGTVP